MTLKKYLEINKVSQYRFAKKVNASTANVCRWVNGKFVPSINYLKKIKEITNGQVTVADFYEGK